MIKVIRNIYHIPELRKRILFTLGMIIVFRIGCNVPIPGVSSQALQDYFQETAKGTLLGLFNVFSGGALGRATVFALGIMPYISSSIIFQLLTTIVPRFEQMVKEGGEEGRRKIQRYTRYGTIALSTLQAFGITVWLSNPQNFSGREIVPMPGMSFTLMAVVTLVTGTAFLMWLGEQMTERGIGNGISLIIFFGIADRIPADVLTTWQRYSMMPRQEAKWFEISLLLGLMVATTAAVVLVTQAQRRIPVQRARVVRGRQVYSGSSSYLPLRVNQAGVLPIIFAQSLIMFPATIGQMVRLNAVMKIASYLSPGQVIYELLYMGLIVFFCYFYTAIIFNPVDVADNMKKYGSFIPGTRPGRSTAIYLDKVMTRITLPGAMFLAIIAVVPTIFMRLFNVTFYFGGTSLLILVGVALDTMKQIESHLQMRHYEGFLKKGKLRGRK